MTNVKGTGRQAFPETLKEARRATQEGARELGQEARELADVAQVEFRQLVEKARTAGKQQFRQVGRELVKLGEKLQKLSGAARRAGRKPIKRKIPVQHAAH